MSHFDELNDLLLQLAEEHDALAMHHAKAAELFRRRHEIRTMIDTGSQAKAVSKPLSPPSIASLSPIASNKFLDYFPSKPVLWALNENDKDARNIKDAGIDIVQWFKMDDGSGSSRAFYITEFNEGVVVRKKNFDYKGHPPSVNVTNSEKDAELLTYAAYYYAPFFSQEKQGEDLGFHLFDLRNCRFDFINGCIRLNGTDQPSSFSDFTLVQLNPMLIK